MEEARAFRAPGRCGLRERLGLHVIPCPQEKVLGKSRAILRSFGSSLLVCLNFLEGERPPSPMDLGGLNQVALFALEPGANDPGPALNLEAVL